MSNAGGVSIPLMRFCAGELRCGLVAAAVERLEEPQHNCIQVCDLLGIARALGTEKRTLHLSAYGRQARFIVDGPTALTAIGGTDLIPTGRSLKWPRKGPILGFAKDAEHIVLLLDVAWLIERAS